MIESDVIDSPSPISGIARYLWLRVVYLKRNLIGVYLKLRECSQEGLCSKQCRNLRLATCDSDMSYPYELRN